VNIKIGDKVRIINKNFEEYGTIGKVISVANNICHLDINSNTTSYYSSDNLELITEPAKTYNDGLKDAWALAEKICFMDKDGGMQHKDMIRIFGNVSKYDLFKMDPAEIIEKIELDKITPKLGDIVFDGKNYGIVTAVGNLESEIMYESGHAANMKNIELTIMPYNRKELIANVRTYLTDFRLKSKKHE